MKITLIQAPKDIAKCYKNFSKLRTHYKDQDSFIKQIITTLAWRKILYIDDWVVRNKFKGKGYGGQLLDFAINQAKIISI